MVKLFDYQLDAVKRMKNGCILCGGVGSGKSLTSLGYYYLENGGDISNLETGQTVPMDNPKDLYIITTARKRDTFEWSSELALYHMSIEPSEGLYSSQTVVVDSWNNIGKYTDIIDSWFIFDEQRVVGSGAWVKSFLKITKKNSWILLSATPGDTWSDYIPVFIANGYFKNKTEFTREHVVYSPYTKFPQIQRYLGEGKLIKLRNDILIEMDFERPTISHHEDIFVAHDIQKYKEAGVTRWNPYTDMPMVNAGQLCYVWRRIVNEDMSRQEEVLVLTARHPKVIVFYNFDYELDILRNIPYLKGTTVAEWNGHKHDILPVTDRWVYLVQYTAGSEGWNCTSTNIVIFYSQNYSYKIMTQAAGRIDRLNTPYKDLYYYHLKSRSGIDLAISRALKKKKNFNESKYLSW